MLFLMQLSVILASATIGGYISKKFNQPVVLGQLIFGIIIGPSVLNIVAPTEIFIHMSDLGVILLMFIAGLETDLKEMIRTGRTSFVIALGGVILPIVLGVVAGSLFGRSLLEGIFIGVILSATSVSITVETLREIDKLKTPQGMAILGAAVIDDVIGIVLLSLMIGFVNPGEGLSFIKVIVNIMLFFIVSCVIGMFIIKFSRKYFLTKNTSKNIAVIALVFCLLFGYFAEEMGVAAITGAYVAGIVLSETPFRRKITNSIEDLSYVLLTPIFFVVTGMKVDISQMFYDLPFGIVLLVAAVFGKIIGCGGVAKLFGFKGKESLQIGIGMVPRGEVALIVTDIGLKLGVIPKGLFASIIFMILATTIGTPPFLKRSFD